MSVILGLGRRKFGAFSALPVAHRPDGLRVGDFNSDGKLDIVTPGGEFNERAVLSYLRGDGKGGFNAQITFPLGGSGRPTGVASGDLDGDGIPDAIVGLGRDKEVAILRGSPTGAFADALQVKTANHAGLADDRDPNYLAVGDFNEDNALDIAATNSSGYVSLLLTAR